MSDVRYALACRAESESLAGSNPDKLKHIGHRRFLT
jgi:hypothetical protein